VFAPAEKMMEYLNLTPGAVSFFGLMHDTQHQVRLLADEDLMRTEYLGCHPCVNTSTLRLHTQDVFGPLCQAMEHPAAVVSISSDNA